VIADVVSPAMNQLAQSDQRAAEPMPDPTGESDSAGPVDSLANEHAVDGLVETIILRGERKIIGE